MYTRQSVFWLFFNKFDPIGGEGEFTLKDIFCWKKFLDDIILIKKKNVEKDYYKAQLLELQAG